MRASVFYFLAEGARYYQEYDASVDLLLKAVDLIDEEKEIPSMAIILSRIGIATYELGRYKEAYYYLNRSIALYEKTIFTWGKEETLQYQNASLEKIS